MSNNDLNDKVIKFSGTDSGNTYVTVDQLAYDATNKKLGLKVNGADSVIPFSGGGAKLVGRYTSSTTIDVSSYGATSVSQFLAVSETTNGQYKSPYASGSASYWDVYGKYTAPSLSLNSAHTQLRLTIGTLWARDLFEDGRHSFTVNCPCKIYFVGDIT